MHDQSTAFTFNAIGVIKSPFKEKFGIPRQPGLTPDILSSIHLFNNYNNAQTLDALSSSSHLWILFVFSENYDFGWKPKVRPPRLGGNKKVGVFATRSPYRPNPIGISAVKLAGIRQEQGKFLIDVAGADIMHNTPILDIKPYIPYSDNITGATHSLAQAFAPLSQTVFFSAQAQQACEQFLLRHHESLSIQIEQVLRCDPRPAYHKNLLREYGINLHNLNIRWQISEHRIDVISID
ncbi:MAG: tRNA-Thr(GGU) m(6)t(6)A37 methyltransferase TsaA [Oceanospirillaceae bacterium]|jgi:tRNA-Thr(GGU) m(6)t(6)A37 methyltransferase TsaA